MNSISCHRVRELLPEVLRGCAAAAQATAVDEHLSACADCSAVADTLRTLLRHPPAVPEGLAGRVLAELRQPAPVPAAGSVSVRTTRRWWQRAGAMRVAAAVAAVVGASVWFSLAIDGGGTVAPTALDGAQALYQPLSTWPGYDGYVAGSVVLESLTDAELESLLEDLQW